MREKGTCFIFQRELRRKDRPAYHHPPMLISPDTPAWQREYLEFWPSNYPWVETALLPSPEKLRFSTRANLLQESALPNTTLCGTAGYPYKWAVLFEDKLVFTDLNHNLLVPQPLVAYYGLREGDRIRYTIDHSLQAIWIDEVNGVTDPKIMRSWPDLEVDFHVDHPIREVPLSQVGSHEVRMAMDLAPIGFGQSYWVLGEGRSGKTSMLVEMIQAATKLLTQIDNLVIVIAFIGDRPPDFALYKEIAERVPPSFQNRIIAIQSPWSDYPEMQISVLKFVRNLVHRLIGIGHQVFWFQDSITRSAAAFADSELVDSSRGMLRQGLTRQALPEIIARVFGVYGRFLWKNPKHEDSISRNLTIMGTGLVDESSSEAVIADEVGDTATSGILRLGVFPAHSRRPWLKVNPKDSYTRFPIGRDFRDPETRERMERHYMERWGITKEGEKPRHRGDEALRILRDQNL